MSKGMQEGPLMSEPDINADAISETRLSERMYRFLKFLSHLDKSALDALAAQSYFTILSC